MENQSFNFLRQYIEQLLDDSGAFSSLTEETRAEYVPQFVAEAERRIGLSVLPLLDEAGAEEFAALVQKEDVSAEALRDFWYAKVPNLDEVMKKTLEEFKTEFFAALSAV